MVAQYKQVRIIYAGTKNFIHLLVQDFLKFGVDVPNGEIPSSLTLRAELFKQLAPALQSFPTITIYFYSDVYELAKDLPKFDADLIILDERVVSEELAQQNSSIMKTHDEQQDLEQVLHSSLQTTENDSTKEIRFENLRSAIEKFTPLDFNYTMRRVVVVLPKEARKTEREFTLGVAQVRGIIVEPPNSVDLFLYATKGLLQFYQTHKKTSLCFSGGGVEGYLYSLGVAHALENSFINKTCHDFDIFCGASSGAIIASCLAAKMSTDLLVKQMNRQVETLEPIGLNTIFDLATGEFVRKIFRLLKAFSTPDLGEAISRFQDAIPLGLFRGEKLKQFLERQMQYVNVENNIRKLAKELYISVTEQDTGENIILGEEPWRDIKISQAVRASTALPPFYLPEKINGHWFSDGQITGGSGFTHAIQKGAGLVINIDPVVAYTSNMPGAMMKRGGYFTLLQAVKGLVQSRATSMLKHSMDKNPDVDFINFYPTDEVMEAMAGNPMKYRIRTELIALGFKCTVGQILASYEAMSHKFAKHGFILKSSDELRALGLP